MSTLTRSLFTTKNTKKTSPTRRRSARHHGPGRHEALEPRLAMATLLGTDPLVFDPTPGNAASGDEVNIGTITYQMEDDRSISVGYQIGASFQSAYDLSAVHTTINGGSLGDTNSTGLPAGTESLSHSFALPLPLPSGVTALDIDACATIEKRDVAAVGVALPSVGTVRVGTTGSIAGVPSYFDTILMPGWIPTSTDVAADTVTFATDPGWATGTAVRVVAGYVASLSGTNDTGLVTRPTATDTTTSATYYARTISPGTYSFHATHDAAVVGTLPANIVAAIPTSGEIVITGENEALPFLGQTPIDESRLPISTKFTLTSSPFCDVVSYDGTAERIVLAKTEGLANGDRVRMSAAFGGLSTSITYWVRVIDAVTVELYNGYAAAIDTPSTVGRIGLSGTGSQTPPVGTTINTVDPDDETVSFAVDPGWVTGTAVRVSASGGNLSAGTTYYVRNSSGAYAFYASQAEAWNTDANIDPLSGRRDLTAAVTASVFPNVTALSFPAPHGWGTGTVVRVSATGGGLTLGTNYYVRALDADTISLHTTLANAQAGLSPVNFTAPITALVTPMFDGWCVDDDRFIGSNELIANLYSSYEESSFPDTTGHTKDQYGTDAGLSPINTSAVPSTTDLLNDRVTFTANHGWSTGQAVRVTATEGGLTAVTTYYVRSINSTTVSFHATATGATTNTGRIDLTAALSPTTLVFRCESVDFAVTNVNWPNGTKVRVDVSDGGLVAGQNYYVRGQNVVGGAADSNSVSFYDTRAHALAGGMAGLVTLTDPLEATTKVYVPEELVENPENLDVMNWILNQDFQSILAVGQTPIATNDVSTITSPTSTSFVNVGVVPDSTDSTADSVTFLTDPSWSTGTLVRVTATGGGLAIGTNYYVNSLGGGEYLLYNSAANASVGSSTGRINLTAPITAGIYDPSLFPTDDTVTFAPGHGFMTGSVVNVTADGGGLDASTTYWLKLVGPDTFSFHTSSTVTDANKVDLTAAITAGIRLQSDETVTMASASGWTTGLKVQVSTSAGGLVAGTDYWIRAFSTTNFAFYASAADASNNVNRIDLTGSVAPAVVRPYYTSGDVQRAIWQVIENNPGDPGNWSPARVAEILAAANAAVGLDDPNVGYVPDCNGTVAIIIQPFEVVGGGTDSKSQVTIAQITVAEVPAYCADGFNCQEFSISLGSIGDFVWHDLDGDGIQDAGEPGTPGVTAILLDGSGNPIGTGYTTTTGPDGSYLFTGLLPGSCSVQFLLPSGNVFTRQNAGADDTLDSDASRTTGRTGAYALNWITTPAGIAVASDLSVDAGWVNPIDVCGVKVWDIDRDGARGGINDPGDQRMAGVRIFVDDNTNGVLDWTDSVTTPNGLWDLGEGEQWTTTGTDGSYCLLDLLPGTYVIREDMTSLPGNPAEWQSSGPVTIKLIEDGDRVDGVNFYNYKFTDGEYRTYTLGGYGGSGQPATYLLANFAGAFPDPTYLTVPRPAAGSANDIVLTSGSQVQAFLRANNPKTAFTNPTVSKYVPSTLEKQFVALTLNVRFDATYANFGSSGLLLGDLILCNLTGTQSAANGLSVSAFLSQVYGSLDGNGYTLGLSAGDLTSLLDAINKGFDNGGVTTWAEEHLCAAMPGVAAAMSTPRVQTITVMAPQTRDSVITYRVTFTMPVSGVDAGDFTFTGSRGRILGVTGRGAVYTVRALAPQVGATYRLALRDNDSIRAVYGNHALASAFAADGSFQAPGVRKARAVGIRAFATLGS